MKLKLKIWSFLLFAIYLMAMSCEKEEDKNTLTVSKDTIQFSSEGGSATFKIETNAEEWSIDNPASEWISISTSSGTTSEALIILKVDSRTLVSRSDTLIVSAGTAEQISIVVSQSLSEYLYDLSTDITTAEFEWSSGSSTLKVSSGAPEWNLTCEADWVQFSQDAGADGTFSVTISVSENSTTEDRSTTVTLSGADAPSTEISLTQSGGLPSYNTNPLDPDSVGMESDAEEIASQLTVGWNIGNTLEAIGGETAWGNPKVTEDLIKLVKDNGFNAIRIPCSWNQYVEDEETAKISEEWLQRVKEVVGYCVDNDVYVILNIHWDGGWLENNCTTSEQVANNSKQKAFWEQIATYLRDFDEHLMFAGSNEPNVDNATQMKVLLSYHQTFIDAVRATGGKNSYRVLIVQGPFTDIEKTNDLMNTMPTDEIDGRMMAEVHYYTPYQFCLMTEDASWGNMVYYWGEDYHSETDTDRNATWGEESTIDELFGQMNTKFVKKGIPVILGEYGVVKRTSLTGDDLDLHLASRAYYLKYLVQLAKANGIIPFYWDTGYTGENNMTIFNRTDNSVYDQQALDAIMEGAGE